MLGSLDGDNLEGDALPSRQLPLRRCPVRSARSTDAHGSLPLHAMPKGIGRGVRDERVAERIRFLDNGRLGASCSIRVAPRERSRLLQSVWLPDRQAHSQQPRPSPHPTWLFGFGSGPAAAGPRLCRRETQLVRDLRRSAAIRDRARGVNGRSRAPDWDVGGPRIRPRPRTRTSCRRVAAERDSAKQRPYEMRTHIASSRRLDAFHSSGPAFPPHRTCYVCLLGAMQYSM